MGWGIYNYVGHNDVALQAAVAKYFFGLDQKVSETVVQETFHQFGEYAGLAAHFTICRWVLERYPPYPTSSS